MSSPIEVEDSLYGKVVNITDEYLGPAADRFVARQISNHLHKNPLELNRKDLKRLIDWAGLAMSVLCEDEKLVHTYITNLKNLTVEKNGGF